MATDKKSFILYCDQRGTWERLSDEQAGKLIKHVISYVNDENPESDFVTELAFEGIKRALKSDLIKYEAIKAKRSEAGRRGGKQTQANQASATFAQANQAVSVNGNVNVNVNDNVNVNVDYKDIISEWNSFTWKLSKLKALNTERKKHLKIRIKEHGREELSNAFKKVKDSEFLQGENDSNWKANFDWVINSSNFVKIIEGNYDNQQTTRNPLMR